MGRFKERSWSGFKCLLPNELIKRSEQNSWQNLGEKPARAIFFHLEQHVSNISGLLVSANYENAVFSRQYRKLVCINGMISESWVFTLMNYNYLRPHLQIFITQRVASLAHYTSVLRIWRWLHSHTHPRICKRTQDAPWEGGAAVLGIGFHSDSLGVEVNGEGRERC